MTSSVAEFCLCVLVLKCLCLIGAYVLKYRCLIGAVHKGYGSKSR